MHNAMYSKEREGTQPRTGLNGGWHEHKKYGKVSYYAWLVPSVPWYLVVVGT